MAWDSGRSNAWDKVPQLHKAVGELVPTKLLLQVCCQRTVVTIWLHL